MLTTYVSCNGSGSTTVPDGLMTWVRHPQGNSPDLFTGTDESFTAPFTGFYEINAHAYFAASATGTIAIAIAGVEVTADVPVAADAPASITMIRLIEAGSGIGVKNTSAGSKALALGSSLTIKLVQRVTRP
jgi:hypothetical protein